VRRLRDLTQEQRHLLSDAAWLLGIILTALVTFTVILVVKR